MSIVEVAQPPVGDTSTGGRALLGLRELIAVNGIVEEVREVREEIQIVVQNEGRRSKRRRSCRSLIFSSETLSIRLPGISRIESATARR
jgi:hypothetical protein